MSARQRKLWELQQKLRASRKQNQDAMVAEKRRQARPDGAEEAGEKRKWYEEKSRRREADLKRMNLDEKKVRCSMEFSRHHVAVALMMSAFCCKRPVIESKSFRHLPGSGPHFQASSSMSLVLALMF